MAPPGEYLPEPLVGQRVEVSGRWIPGDFLIVTSRFNDGEEGCWVTGQLRIDGTAAPASVAVAIGWAATLDDARAVVGDMRAGKGTVGKLLIDDTLYTETTTAMVNLREILQKINQGQGTVGQLVNDKTVLDNAKLTLQKVEKATEGLEDQGPLSVLGIAVNSLF